jgi:HSP20 family protein
MSLQDSAIIVLKYSNFLSFLYDDLRKRKRRFKPSVSVKATEEMETLRRQMETLLDQWPYPMTHWRFPVLADTGRAIRLPLYDMVDKGEKYELQLEIPGIDKEKVDVKATKNSVEISGEQSEKAEEKRKNYLYNERSYRSFHRRITTPEEIIPSKIDAKMTNGILQIELQKRFQLK